MSGGRSTGDRRSPIESWFETSGASVTTLTDAVITADFQRRALTSPKMMLVDLSKRVRAGFKGPAAEDWLVARGLTPARGANRWHQLPSGELIARLATSEFLIEQVTGDCRAIVQARRALEPPRSAAGVFPVVRQDFVVMLSGPKLMDCLREVCTIDFAPVLAASTSDSGPVILTSMLGVSAVALAHGSSNPNSVTLWIDPSFAHYFWTTLFEVSMDLGAGTTLYRV